MRTLALTILSFVALATLRADDSPPYPDGTTIYSSSPLDPTEYGCDSQINDQVIFAPFQLDKDYTLNIARWWGQFSSGTEGNGQTIGTFNVAIFADNPNATTFNGFTTVTMDGPGALLATATATLTGVPSGIPDPLQGGNIMTWTMAFSDLPVTAGNYWFSVAADQSVNTYFEWQHSDQSGSGTLLGGVNQDSNPRFTQMGAGVADGSMAFEVGDPPVNTPDATSTLALLAAGIMGLGLVRRRLSSS